MSNRSVYLVDPNWVGDREDSDQSVVEEYPDTLDKFQVARELWRLVGEDERAMQISLILSRAWSRSSRALDTDEITQILALTQGIEEALRAARWVDEHARVPAEKVAELRSRTHWLDLSEARGESARSGLWEGVGGIWRLRHVLQQALDQGLHVALD